MHSSRMRTGHSLTICQSLLPKGGVCSMGAVCSWGVSAPGGCLLLGDVCSGGVCSGSCLLQGVCSGGVSAPGGVLSGGCLLLGGLLWGVSVPGGCVVSQHALRQTPPPVNRMTDRCKNIILATTSLRPVITACNEVGAR